MTDTEKVDRSAGSAGALLVLAAEIAHSCHVLREEVGDAAELTRDQEFASARLMGLCEGFGLAVAEPHLTEMYAHGERAMVAAIALDVAQAYADAGELLLETVDAADESGLLAKLRAARDSFGGSS